MDAFVRKLVALAHDVSIDATAPYFTSTTTFQERRPLSHLVMPIALLPLCDKRGSRGCSKLNVESLLDRSKRQCARFYLWTL